MLSKEDSKNFQNLYKSHLQIIGSEILHHHLKLFQKDLLRNFILFKFI